MRILVTIKYEKQHPLDTIFFTASAKTGHKIIEFRIEEITSNKNLQKY